MSQLAQKDSKTFLSFLLHRGREVLRKVAMLANQCTTVMLNSTKSNDGATEATTHLQRTDICRGIVLIGSELNCTRERAVLLFLDNTDEAVSTLGKYFANTHLYNYGKILS
jgi:hypothetical protein